VFAGAKEVDGKDRALVEAVKASPFDPGLEELNSNIESGRSEWHETLDENGAPQVLGGEAAGGLDSVAGAIVDVYGTDPSTATYEAASQGLASEVEREILGLQ